MKFLSLIILIFLPLAVQSADVIPTTRTADWSNVGVQNGIPNRTVISATLSSPQTAAQIQAALRAAAANQVVVLSAGTYNLADNIDWQGVADGVVLRGQVDANGLPTTTLVFSNGRIYMRRFFDSPHTSSAALTADFAKGSNIISLSSVPSWVVVGELYVINELNDAALISETTDEGAQAFETGRALGHIVKVTAKTSTTITTELPSPYTYRTSKSAHLTTANYNPGSGHASRKSCGLENLNLKATYIGSGTSHMVFMENTDGCWLKNVNSDTVAGGIHVMMYGCYRNEIRHSIFHNSKLFNGGQGYGVAAYEGGAGHLVVDNEFYNLHVAVQMNYSTAQSVIAYNYIHNGIADVQQDPGMNQHGVVAFQILWEGNWSGPKYTADDTHGSGGYLSTVFRNRITGDGGNSYTFDRSCINLRRYCRSFNIVGNVLGTASYHTIYQRQATVDSYKNSTEKVIYAIGYGANGDDDAATMDVLRRVNYDVVSGLVLGGSQLTDLVKSYWLPSKPSWFGNLDWPPYGPDIGTDAGSTAYTRIPAGYRALHGVDPAAGPQNLPPVALIGSNPKLGSAPLTVTFSSVGSVDPEGASLTYNWVFGDGSTSTAANPAHIYLLPGSYAARLTVSDGTNLVSSTNLNITVTIPGQNLPPIALAATPTSGGMAPFSVSFSSLGSLDPEGASLTYNWVFGDGATATTANPSHMYSVSGVYIAQLTVSDGTNTSLPALITITAGNAATGLVASYGFEETNGTAASDTSGNGYNGTIVSATRTTGKFGSALSFNGTSSMVTIADAAALDLTTAMTLEAWVYPTALGGWRDVIFKGTDIYFLMGSTPQGQAPGVGGTFASANAYGTAALPLNTWSHLAGSYDGTTMRLYVNGVQVASRAQTGTIATSTGELSIGGDATAGQFWAGMIDEVRVYNRALNATEIQSDMAAPVVGGTKPNPPTNLRVVP